MQTVALAGGIPHSTGYPLWVALAHAFTWLPLGPPEFRVTLFSAVCGALALALLVRRLGDLGVALAASVTAACFLGVTFSFWRVSVRAEVYTLTFIVALLAMGALLAARRAPAGERFPALRAAVLLGLMMTLHLGFAPVVLVVGLALAWREWRAGAEAVPPHARLARLPMLLAAFLAGLTPYLLLLAIDASGARVNSIDMVRHARAILGGGEPLLDSPVRGVWWLLTGRNVYPPEPFAFHPRSILAGLKDCAAVLFLFELGPVALPLAIAGFVRRFRRDASLAVLLLACFMGSMLFAATLQYGAMLHLFQLPAILIGACFVADGLDAMFERLLGGLTRRAAAAFAIASMAWLALALPPALIRVHAAAHPIGERGWQAAEEDRALDAGLVPGMQGERGAERWSRAALAVIPRDALVLAMWSDFAPLRYLRVMEGRRPDLTLDEILGGTLALRVRQWQEAHDLARAPIVFAARGAREAPYLAGADSVAVADGRFAFVITRPLADSLLDAEIARAR